MKRAYRLFKVSKDFMPETLFHAWKGSRTLPLDEVMVAPRKRVYNPGSRTNVGFIAGWHMALTYEEAGPAYGDPKRGLAPSPHVCRIGTVLA